MFASLVASLLACLQRYEKYVKCQMFLGREVNWRSNDCQGKVKASQWKVKGKSSEVNGGQIAWCW